MGISERLLSPLHHSSFTMPAAPPNVSSIRKAAEGSKRSAEALSLQRDNTLPIVSNRALEPEDESQYEIPPGVDTPWTFGSFIRYFGPGWLVCIAYVDPVDAALVMVRAVHVRQAPTLHQHESGRSDGFTVPEVCEMDVLGDCGSLYYLDGSAGGHWICYSYPPFQSKCAVVCRSAAVFPDDYALLGDTAHGILLH